jgi:molybdopterin/thiamine biosynthesis adenylyltransferase
LGGLPLPRADFGNKQPGVTDFSDDEVERYSRQLVLREWGGPGQQKMKRARVLVVGAGGLGGPAALHLAGAGVGVIGLADFDRVALSNLHRQVLFDTTQLGMGKVSAAGQRLAVVNPHTAVEKHPIRVDRGNARGVVADYDLVLDGTDDFATRFAVNAACLVEGKPLVSGAVARWSGQVGVFTGRPCWRCLVPEVPPDTETCAAVGVAGPLVGVIGAAMALEAVKLITGAGMPLLGRLMRYDGLSGEARTATVQPDPACPDCGQR